MPIFLFLPWEIWKECVMFGHYIIVVSIRDSRLDWLHDCLYQMSIDRELNCLYTNVEPVTLRPMQGHSCCCCCWIFWPTFQLLIIFWMGKLPIVLKDYSQNCTNNDEPYNELGRILFHSKNLGNGGIRRRRCIFCQIQQATLPSPLL